MATRKIQLARSSKYIDDSMKSENSYIGESHNATRENNDLDAVGIVPGSLSSGG